MKTKILPLLCVLGMILTGGSALADDHGDFCAAATPIIPDITVPGTLEEAPRTGIGIQPPTDMDMFRLDLPSSGHLTTFTTYTDQATDTFGSLLDSSCSIFASSDAEGFVYNFEISRHLPWWGTYYISVRPYDATNFPFINYVGNGSGTYTLHVQFAPTGVGAVTIRDDNYPGLIAHENGELIAPMVDRDCQGNIVRLRGAIWMSPSGDSFVVVNRADGLPKQAVYRSGGKRWGFVYSNYTADTVDVAVIYPERVVHLCRGVKVNAIRLQQLRAAAGRAASGGFLSVLEALQLSSPVLNVAGCSAVTTSCWTLECRLPCNTLLTRSIDIYLPQYQNFVFQTDLFCHFASCDPANFEGSLPQLLDRIDQKLLGWISYWHSLVPDRVVPDDIVEECAMVYLLLMEGFNNDNSLYLPGYQACLPICPCPCWTPCR